MQQRGAGLNGDGGVGLRATPRDGDAGRVGRCGDGFGRFGDHGLGGLGDRLGRGRLFVGLTSCVVGGLVGFVRHVVGFLLGLGCDLGADGLDAGQLVGFGLLGGDRLSLDRDDGVLDGFELVEVDVLGAGVLLEGGRQ